MEDFWDKFKMNYFIKCHAQDFIENPNAGTMTNLLAELVIRIEDECEALVPMVVDGERIYYDTVPKNGTSGSQCIRIGTSSPRSSRRSTP